MFASPYICYRRPSKRTDTEFPQNVFSVSNWVSALRQADLSAFCPADGRHVDSGAEDDGRCSFCGDHKLTGLSMFTGVCNILMHSVTVGGS